jgi:SAM-dependent methyltransferase
VDLDAMSTPVDERIVPGTAVWDASWPDHIQRYRFALGYVPEGSRVLDAGCGVGYGAAEVADARRARVVAVDIADQALDLARRHFDRPSITWCRDDCETMSAAAAHAPFDVVINFENIEHLARPAQFVSRAVSLLGPDGVLLTSTPNRLLLNRLRGVPPDSRSANEFHLNEFSEAEFRTLLSQHFEDVEIWYQSPAGASRLRLRLLTAARRAGLARAVKALRRVPGLGRPRTAAGSPGGGVRDWSIERRDTGTAWTLIAVCRRPRLSAAQTG